MTDGLLLSDQAQFEGTNRTTADQLPPARLHQIIADEQDSWRGANVIRLNAPCAWLQLSSSYLFAARMTAGSASKARARGLSRAALLDVTANDPTCAAGRTC
jgi:hypothetical protein